MPFFASVFTAQPTGIPDLGHQQKFLIKEGFPLVEQNWVIDHLDRVNNQMPVGLMRCIYSC